MKRHEQEPGPRGAPSMAVTARRPEARTALRQLDDRGASNSTLLLYHKPPCHTCHQRVASR